ncbi:DEAD/DEAH box helicase [Candidatus Woesearchaeota archaeon]|nr:DEAD/DEAH box helicase [Candidatus Woesearchaeota archaeon]
MEYKGLILDPFQEKAIAAIEENKSVIVSAPTGSGKTLIADYIISRDIVKGVKVIYTAPIKALSNQKYKEFCKDYGEENVGLLTGDIAKNPDASILIMTTEIYRNMVLVDDPLISEISYVIFDEIHFINDVERGYVWEESIIFSKEHVRMLCLSATIPNADEFAAWIRAIKGHPVEVIRHDVRMVPLEVHFYDTELGICALKDIFDQAYAPKHMPRKHQKRERILDPRHIDLVREIKDKTPCMFFAFSRSGCQKKAGELLRERLFAHNPAIPPIIHDYFKDSPPEINLLESTKLLRQTLPYGIAFHHAGLLPIMKELVEDLFSRGMINVLYTTETFAVGLNMPAKTVCFEALRKFDGRYFRLLNSKEFFQIAGRAGRRGIDTIGYVYSMISRRDFEYEKVRDLTSADTAPIKSQFKLSVNTVLNLIKQHNKKEIDEILCKSFHSYQQYGKKFETIRNYRSHNMFDNIKKKVIEKMGYVQGAQLTEKGEFASKIYADEILTTEIFATDFYKTLNEYTMLMLIAAICYEARDTTKFFHNFPSKDVDHLKVKVKSHPYLKHEQRFEYFNDLTALVHPCYYGESFFKIIENTNLLEGDLVRFFRQLIDRIKQVQAASRDERLRDLLDAVVEKIDFCLKDIDVM